METSNARDTIVKAKELIAQLNPLEERHMKGIQAKRIADEGFIFDLFGLISFIFLRNFV